MPAINKTMIIGEFQAYIIPPDSNGTHIKLVEQIIVIVPHQSTRLSFSEKDEGGWGTLSSKAIMMIDSPPMGRLI